MSILETSGDTRLLTLFSVRLVSVIFPLGLTILLRLFPFTSDVPLPASSCSGWDTVFAVAVVAAAMFAWIVCRAAR